MCNQHCIIPIHFCLFWILTIIVLSFLLAVYHRRVSIVTIPLILSCIYTLLVTITMQCVSLYCTDLTPPVITTVVPLESSITVRWTPQLQPCAVRYHISWMYTNDDGTTATGSGVSDQVTNYTIPTTVQGVYTVSVQAVDGVGNVGPAASLRVKSSK